MAHRVFLSYSSKDQAAADEICRALEAEGIPCWIAPRDIAAGSQWGGSIVEAIEGADAVLVVFTDAANASPQVAREMEVAVANRRPLIPVRVANAQPTEDMKYFLGVSHWLNAYERPLTSYLPDIVAATRRVLGREAGVLSRVARVIPRTRNGQIAAGAGAIVLVAVLTAALMRPAAPRFEMPENPLTGRWQASLAGADGRKVACVLDVQSMGQASFSDACPLPFTGAQGNLGTVESGVWAPSLYQPGDGGTFTFMGGTLHNFAAAYRVKGKRLVTRDAQFGEIAWKRVSAREPLKNAIDEVLPQQVAWPLPDMPGLAARATAYARSHWKPDALLMEIDVELLEGTPSYTNLRSPAGALQVEMRFYSPETQEGMQLNPGAAHSTLFSFGVVDWDPRRALPVEFVDLPAAVDVMRARGMRAKQIKSAELRDWGERSWQGGQSMSGVAWMIRSTLDESAVVPAVGG